MAITTKTAIVTLDSGVKVFYREAGDATKPTVLLLHGFPTSSFQFRHLIPYIAATGKYHVLAPDLPGFGFTEVPKEFKHGFDGMKNVARDFTDKLGIKEYAVYIFDYGSPTAFRLALERPQAIKAIITQNGNAYVEGFGADFWAPIEKFWASGAKEDRENLRGATGLGVTTWQYTQGAPADRHVDPSIYHLDAALMAREGNADIQLDIFYDYQNNKKLYPDFQKYLRDNKPPVLAVWGKNDPIFIPAGAEAFKRDVPDAVIKFVDGGHFPLETHLEEIGDEIIQFLNTKVKW